MDAIEPPLLENEGVPEGKAQKAKTLPCRYCQKRFRRLEHVQRHERTHTKEKPFKCDCGKTFGRRDLLVRHDKLVHSNENPKHPRTPKTLLSPTSTSNGGGIDPDLLHTPQSSGGMVPSIENISTPGSMLQHRTPGCNLDLLSDAANHLASGNDQILHQTMLTPLPQSITRDGLPSTVPFSSSMMDEDISMKNSVFPGTDTPGPVDDYNFFLDDFGLTSHFLPSAFDTDYLPPFWSSKAPESDPGGPSGHHYMGGPLNQHLSFSNSFSRFGSRLPSLQPESEAGQGRTSNPEDFGRSSPVWKISSQDYQQMQIKLDGFSSTLPAGFSLPSRHTLSRFLEGYINGFHEHLPFFHIPTFSPVSLAPEVLLTLAAVGAQYRFESHRGNALWYAARDIALEQLRRRRSHGARTIVTPPSTYRPEYNSCSPNGGSRVDSLRDDDMSDQGRSESPETPDNNSHARLQTVMALLLLMAMGTWGPRVLLREALSLQSIIALLVREDGLAVDDEEPENITFEEWIRMETRKRTKLIVYCFFNLHCIAYNMPPLILNSEVQLRLPHSATLWKAETVAQWTDLRRTSNGADVSFQEAFARLFCAPATPGKTLSTLGNYCLIHGLIQHIFFVRQTSTGGQGSLKPSDIDNLGQALRVWQAGWEQTPESNLDPNSPHGPVAFNSTALLRLAYIRLHSDLGPCRRLDTRDPIRIAWAFKNSPPLVRSQRLGRAVLQSASALAIPVRIGINFVAKTQTFSWSIQHSLCNLECAFLLSKWLETIAMSTPDDPLTTEEKNLLDMVRSMLDETEFAVLNEESGRMGVAVTDERTKIRQLGAAVVRLWAETFKGTHVFEFVRLIGKSLETYADLLEKGISEADD